MNVPVERSRKSAKKTRRREQLILALLQQTDLEKAAASIGISPSTAYRIRKTPEFQAEYLEARREAVSQSIARLQQGSGAATSTLLKIMRDPKTPAATRVRAADRVMEHAKNFLEIEDVEVRLQRLEQQIAERGGGESR
jgi:CRP-like cAMP-binding protein